MSARDDDLVRYLKGLRRRWKLILLVTVVAVLAAVAVSLRSPTEYDATAKLLLTGDQAVDRVLERDAGDSSDDLQREVNTSADLVREELIANRVRERLELDISTEDLLEQVETETDDNSNVVSIVVRDESPEQAARIANAFGEEYAAFRRDAERRNLDAAADLIRTQRRELGQDGSQSAAGADLQARLRELEVAAALITGGVEVVEATPPDEAASPRPVLTGALAAFLGLLLGGALAFARELTDRRLKTREGVEETLDLPVLATVPRPRTRRDRGGASEDSGQKEGYATLATNLRYFKLGRELRSLLITSPGPGEGKTQVTLGLARALTAAGQRVVAVEADLRRPAFAKYAAVRGVSGLSSILAGVSTFEDEVTEIDVTSLEPVDPAYANMGASFWILPGGPSPPNPQALLSTDGMRDVLQRAASFADVVLVDTPPVVTVNDAVTLVELVGATVLVLRANGTTRDSARQAQRFLSNVKAPILGTVLTNVPPTHGPGYGYERVEPRLRAAESTPA